MEDDIFLKSTIIVEWQGMWLIHPIENMVFHLNSSLKIKKGIVIITSRIMKVVTTWIMMVDGDPKKIK